MLSHELGGPQNGPTSHQTPIAILLRQPVDVSHPQEIGVLEWKSTVIFLNVEKAADELWLPVGSGWWAAGEGCGDQQRGRVGIRTQRLQRLNNLHVISSPNPSSLKSLWANSRANKWKSYVVFFFFCLSADWWFAAKWGLAPVSVRQMTAHQINFHRHWTRGAHFSRKREKQA